MSNTSTTPYISMITPTRNDDYAGGILHRLQFTINILIEQVEKYELESELIIVEYNPPPGKERLRDALVFPYKSEFLSIRIITVPSEIHDQYPLSNCSPINGAVADNVGLRRARGNFSLLRVSDIIWSEEFISMIAKRSLDKNSKYRCTRCDIDSSILEHPEWSLDQKIEFCRNNIRTKMINMKYYVKGLPDLAMNSGGDCQLMSTDNMKRLRGYMESNLLNSPYCDGFLEFCAYAAGINDILKEDIYIYKINHGTSYKNRMFSAIIPFYGIIGKYIPDFLAGPTFIKLARKTRFTQLFLDNRKTYLRGILQPTRNDYYNLCRKIVNGEISYVLNDENWGLGSEQLEDTMVLRASWDTA